jgi:hypothetical protein
VSNQTRIRPSDHAAVPADVTDLLLWRLAVDVAAAHQPGEDGRCGNLLCATETGQCAALQAAQRAMHVARAFASSAQKPRPMASSTITARGRAPVPVTPHPAEFTGWFVRPAPQPGPHPSVAAPNPPPHRLPATAASAA